MSVIDRAISIAQQIAADNSHGYEWGGWGPDYDCGHLVIDAWETAGVPVKSSGASYTGNMVAAFLRCGFRIVNGQVNLATGAGLQAGDVLVNVANHAAMYIGGGQIVQARSNFDGVPGDSSGQEIREQGYYNYPWDYVLRYAGGSASGPADEAPPAVGDPPVTGPTEPPHRYCDYSYAVDVFLLKQGCYGPQVTHMQQLLAANGFDPGDIDGDFGPTTAAALRDFQTAAGIGVDGEWGGESFKAIWNYKK